MRQVLMMRYAVTVVVLMGCFGPTHAAPSIVRLKYVAGGGGNSMSNGNISLLSTAGQTTVGSGTDAGQELGLYAGFWTPGGVPGITAIDEIPAEPALYRNSPNPFNPMTVIRYEAGPRSGVVQLRIYDVQGRLVCTLVDGIAGPGIESVTWQGRNDRGDEVASGLYFVRLQVDGRSMTRKMMLVR